MPKKTSDPFITLDEILAYIKKELTLDISPAAVYGYIARKNFPQNIGLGRPRLWRRAEVERWVQEYKEPKAKV